MMRTLAVICVVVLSQSAYGWCKKAYACPYCASVGLTLTEQVAEKSAVVLVSWAGGTKPDPKKEGDVGTTQYEVIEVLKNPKQGIEKGDTITLAIYRPGKKTDLAMLFGDEGVSVRWQPPMDISETAFGYLKNAPSPEMRPRTKRLAYFMKFLEFPDDVIANDAYGEFATADYEHVAALSPKMSRERLRKWLADPNTPVTRHGLYGLMMGLCGKSEDAGFLKKIVERPTEAQSLGIDGIMHGYLLLAGEEALELLEETKLKPQWKTDASGKPVLNADGKKIPFPFSEKYGALQAIRNQWTFGNDKLSKERLKKSLRLTYEHNPGLAEFVIENFSRWGDWAMMPKIAKAFDEIERLSVKRACVRFMFAAAQGEAKTDADKKRIATAKSHLAAMRKAEPELVERIERYEFRTKKPRKSNGES